MYISFQKTSNSPVNAKLRLLENSIKIKNKVYNASNKVMKMRKRFSQKEIIQKYYRNITKILQKIHT